ncbi:MAG TPA: sugar ABC transporter permease [Anaerolineales bacterium]|nr:sugar ABC transporter permease [Anaerolineales bacterium]
MAQAIAQKKPVRNWLLAYVYLAPALLFILVIFVYPVIDLLWRSLTRTTAGATHWSGLAAYRDALTDPVFWQALSNNLRLFLAVPILVALSLIVAAIIFDRVKGWRLYRTIVFIPYVLAIPVVGIVFSYVLQLHGVFNVLLGSAGLGQLAADWLGKSRTAIWALMFVVIWKELGFGVVLFLARMSSISEDLFDAAKLDGANWFQQLWYVTIPQLATVIEFYAIIELITMLSWVFAYVLVMTKGGPGTSTWVMEYFIYQKAFPYNQMQIASAAAILILAFASVLMFLQARLRRQVEELNG